MPQCTLFQQDEYFQHVVFIYMIPQIAEIDRKITRGKRQHNCATVVAVVETYFSTLTSQRKYNRGKFHLITCERSYNTSSVIFVCCLEFLSYFRMYLNDRADLEGTSLRCERTDVHVPISTFGLSPTETGLKRFQDGLEPK